jgi:hypothetical protein
LHFFKEPVTRLHVDVDQTGTLQRDELIFRREKLQLTTMVELKIVDGRAGHFDRVRVGDQALEPDLHLFALTKCFFDKI